MQWRMLPASACQILVRDEPESSAQDFIAHYAEKTVGGVKFGLAHGGRRYTWGPSPPVLMMGEVMETIEVHAS